MVDKRIAISELSILAPNASYYELLKRGDVVEPTSVPFVEMLSIFHNGGFDSHVTNCWDQVTIISYVFLCLSPFLL